MKKMNLFFTAICMAGLSSTTMSQTKFMADDGLNYSKPNSLLFNSIGKYGEKLLYVATPNESFIKWQTVKETNTSHFEMQISFDGSFFTGIKTIAASDYTLWQTDYQVMFRKNYLSASKVYYRLKTVFSDNSVIYSEPAVFKILGTTNKTSYASLH